MKVVMHTLEGSETLEGIVTIRQFPSGNLVLATEDEIEYNTGLDFPTVYKMEVTPENKGA